MVVAPITQGFTLESMGPPSLAAGWFLSTIAPQGSGRTATLLSADERTDTSNTRYYCMEYALEFPSKQPGVNITRHNVSVFATTGDRLYTFNAQCSEVDWPKEAAALTAAAASFRLLPP